MSKSPPERLCVRARRDLNLAQAINGPSSLTIPRDRRHIARLATTNVNGVISLAPSDSLGHWQR
jgi:hypothetical protein